MPVCQDEYLMKWLLFLLLLAVSIGSAIKGDWLHTFGSAKRAKRLLPPDEKPPEPPPAEDDEDDEE